MVRKKNPVLVKISIKVISTVFLLLHILNPANSSVNGGFTSSHLLNNELNKWYAYLACCPRRGLRAR